MRAGSASMVMVVERVAAADDCVSQAALLERADLALEGQALGRRQSSSCH
jgi:hypothetical protein